MARGIATELQRRFPGISFVECAGARAARDEKSVTIETLHWDAYDPDTESNFGETQIANAVRQFSELVTERYGVADYVPNDAPAARGYIEVAEHWSSVTLCVIEKVR